MDQLEEVTIGQDRANLEEVKVSKAVQIANKFIIKLLQRRFDRWRN